MDHATRLLKSKQEPAMKAWPWLLYPWKEIMYPLYRRLGEPQDYCRESSSYIGIQSSDCLAHSESVNPRNEVTKGQ